MQFHIEGKNALVCAASKGMGKAIAKVLAQEGCKLFLCARGSEALSQTIQELQPLTTHPIHSMAVDLSTASGRASLIKGLEDQPFSPDILIHNIGGPPTSTAEATTLEQWQAGFDRLFLSVVHLNQAFVPAMKERQWGRIVTITSSSVLEPIPNLAVSNALRSAVTNYAKTLANELASSGITVNCVAPGLIHTDRIDERIQQTIALQGGTMDTLMAQYVSSIPMGRMGTPEEFAHGVAFLCSDAARYISGITLHIDGSRRHSMV